MHVHKSLKYFSYFSYSLYESVISLFQITSKLQLRFINIFLYNLFQVKLS